MAAIADRTGASPTLPGRDAAARILVIMVTITFEMGIEIGKILPVARGGKGGAELRQRHDLVTRKTAVEIGVPAQLAELAVVDDIQAHIRLSLHNVGDRLLELACKSSVRWAAAGMLLHR